MNIQPLPGKPVLLLQGEETVAVIGDLHIGIESHLRWKGFHLPSRTDSMLQEILGLSDRASRLIILGDVKHRVPGTTRQEVEELPGFFRKLCDSFSEVDLVKGNHDANIEDHIDSDVRLHPPGGMIWEDTGLVHGHTWPSTRVMSCRHLVMAHNHPTVMFHDGVGKRSSEPCWLRGAFRGPGDRYLQVPEGFLVMPAFNPVLGGSPVNVENESLLGPLLNSDLPDLENANIFLLDGINLGRRSDLMVTGRTYRRRHIRAPQPE
ncbi:MAG: metallophosphoesterase [Candidatus Methanomethylophilaceae archaeon]